MLLREQKKRLTRPLESVGLSDFVSKLERVVDVSGNGDIAACEFGQSVVAPELNAGRS
jgi:hypothetical protein